MMPGPIHDFIGKSQFHAGLLLGVVLALVGAVYGFAARRRGRPARPIGGLLVGLGFAVGIAATTALPLSVALGFVLLGLGGFVAGYLGGVDRALVSTALAVPGAIALSTHTGAHRAYWVAPLAIIAVVCAAPLTADFDRRFGVRGGPLVLYAVSVVGVFYAVPNTARALVLLGVALPIALLGWPIALARLGQAGSYVAVGALVWVATYEGRGRDAATIGAIACLGLLVVEPAARALRRGRDTVVERWSNSRWGVAGAVLVQLVLVLVASRVAGIRHATGTAALVVVIEMSTAVLVLWRFDLSAGSRQDRGRAHTSR
jgi:hypothetical protein